MSTPHNRQVLLNYISSARIQNANLTQDQEKIKEANRKYGGLLYSETQFGVINPNPDVPGGYIATIDVPGRGFTMNNHRWTRGTLLASVRAFANVVVDQRALDRVVKPGLYLNQSTNELTVVLDENDKIEKVFAYLGYTFDMGEYTANKKQFTVDCEIMKGKSALRYVDPNQIVSSETEREQIEISAPEDTTKIFIGQTVELNLKAIDPSKTPIGNEVVVLTHYGDHVIINEDHQTTTVDGTAKFSVTGSSVGQIYFKAFHGLEQSSPVLKMEVANPGALVAAFDNTETTEEMASIAVPLTVTLTDGEGNPVSNTVVEVTGDDVVAPSSTSLKTSTKGKATLTLTGTKPGLGKLQFSASSQFAKTELSLLITEYIDPGIPKGIYYETESEEGIKIDSDKDAVVKIGLNSEKGRPVSNTTLKAFVVNTDLATVSPAEIATNDLGKAEFTLAGKAGGDTQLKIQTEGYPDLMIDLKINQIAPQRKIIVDTIVPFEMDCVSSTTITGRVVTDDATPVKGVVVNSVNIDPSRFTVSPDKVTTGEDGSFSFEIAVTKDESSDAIISVAISDEPTVQEDVPFTIKKAASVIKLVEITSPLTVGESGKAVYSLKDQFGNALTGKSVYLKTNVNELEVINSTGTGANGKLNKTGDDGLVAFELMPKSATLTAGLLATFINKTGNESKSDVSVLIVEKEAPAEEPTPESPQEGTNDPV